MGPLCVSVLKTIGFVGGGAIVSSIVTESVVAMRVRPRTGFCGSTLPPDILCKFFKKDLFVGAMACRRTSISQEGASETRFGLSFSHHTSAKDGIAFDKVLEGLNLHGLYRTQFRSWQMCDARKKIPNVFRLPPPLKLMGLQKTETKQKTHVLKSL